MIDHILGRPSVKFRKIQVLTVVAFWSAYLARGNQHGPPVIRRLSKSLVGRLTAWQSVVITFLYLYIARNFGKLVGLECPEPLANLYSRAFFRATWVTTALDAGFWTAMTVRRKWARDILSIVFSVYYLFAAEQADEKVRKIRAVLTVDHLRVSWNKSTSPYLSFATKLLRPRFMRYEPRALRIPRPSTSSYTEPIQAWLYFDGPISALKNQTKAIFHIHGGGFVAMSPRTHDDALIAWAGKTRLPILSIDYRKAPEFPYPYALNECYDAYHSLMASNGRCIGFSGEYTPQVVVTGDSAGGNLATGMTLMVLQAASSEVGQWHGQPTLPTPAGLVLAYPALDVNIGNWMTDEQMALIRDKHARKTNQRIIRHKSSDFRKLAPSTPMPSDDEDETPSSDSLEGNSHGKAKAVTETTEQLAVQSQSAKPQAMRTRLATPSLMAYVSDRILTPEMMRAMIILYIGPHNRPDFSTDYLLSPVLAPESLLAQFPKVYMLTGERDPLVDDTVIFAGRIRQAKAAHFAERKELGLVSHRARFNEQDFVQVKLVEGVSHGFLQFVSLFPEGWDYIFRCASWFEDAFSSADARSLRESPGMAAVAAEANARGRPRGDDDYFSIPHHHRTRTGSSGDEDRPLEMSALGRNGSDSKSEGRHRRSLKHSTHSGLAKEHPLASPEIERNKRHSLHRQNSGNSLDGASSDGKSLVSLVSEDDLLGRRMKGLVSGLIGDGNP